MERLAHEHKPKLIIAGASAYSLRIDLERFAKVAEGVGALLMVDMAHYAGLIAAGVYPNPVRIADVVTSTTHKTLRGPRGGIILMKRRAREGDQLRGLPRLAGRPADARDRRQGGGVQRGAAAGVQALPGAGGRERARARAACCRSAACASSPAAPKATCCWSTCARRRSPARTPRPCSATRAHHRQQERDPERPGKAVGHQRHPPRQPGDDDARLQGDRERGARAPDRRRARRAGATPRRIGARARRRRAR